MYICIVKELFADSALIEPWFYMVPISDVYLYCYGIVCKESYTGSGRGHTGRFIRPGLRTLMRMRVFLTGNTVEPSS